MYPDFMCFGDFHFVVVLGYHRAQSSASSAPSAVTTYTASPVFQPLTVIAAHPGGGGGSPGSDLVTVETGPLAETFAFRFSTKYWEMETGILHYEFRPNSLSLGRWLSRDPIEEAGGINLHMFCGNTPANRFDKLGLLSAMDEADGWLSWGIPPPRKPPVIEPARSPTDCICPEGLNKGKRQKDGFKYNDKGAADDKCSVPSLLTDYLPVFHITNWFFLKSCQTHDECYATYNANRSICDQIFKESMEARCDTLVPILKPACYAAAQTYYAAVMVFGSPSFNESQDKACEDCCCK